MIRLQFLPSQTFSYYSARVFRPTALAHCSASACPQHESQRQQIFYLIESERVEGRPYPAQRMIEYLGNQAKAIAKLEASDYPNKEHLLAKVSAAVPTSGKNQGKRGRPKGSDRSDSPNIPPGKAAHLTPIIQIISAVSPNN